jgi:hypothetical protein
MIENVLVSCFNEFKFIRLEVMSNFFDDIRFYTMGKSTLPSFSVPSQHYCVALERILKENADKDIDVIESSLEFSRLSKSGSTNKRKISEIIKELKERDKENKTLAPKRLNFGQSSESDRPTANATEDESMDSEDEIRFLTKSPPSMF